MVCMTHRKHFRGRLVWADEAYSPFITTPCSCKVTSFNDLPLRSTQEHPEESWFDFKKTLTLATIIL